MPYRAIIAVAQEPGAASISCCCAWSPASIARFAAARKSRRAAHRRRQASVGLGNLRAAAAVRQPGLHPQARTAVDSDLRLAHHQGPHGAGRPRRRLAGAGRHDRARPHRTGATTASSSFSRKARGARAGAEPRYKYGVAHLYAAEGVPCLPIALNSGLFWPRRSLLRMPGTVVVGSARSDPARSRQGRLLRAPARRDRNGDRAADREGQAKMR